MLQFAKNMADGTDHALKFYVRRAGFDRVASLVAEPAVAQCVTFVEGVVSNDWGHATAGQVLPPYVVTRRGETLAEFALRVRPNLPTAISTLAHIAELLAALHAAGYVYNAVKPTNIAWFEEVGMWGLIDFGSAARVGTLPVAPCLAVAVADFLAGM